MLTEFLQWMGLGLCHQLPERSFFGGGVQLPVCARDTGIYVGLVVSLCVIALLHRGERPRGFPRPLTWVILAGFVGLMAFDGLSSYLGLRGTTNEIRLLTGLLTGYAAAAVTYPMLQDELWVSSDAVRVLDPSWRLAVWVATIPAAWALLWWAGPLLGLAYPLLTAASIVGALAAVNLVIVGMFPAFDRKGRTWRDLVVPVALAVVLAFGEIALAAAIRQFLDGLARGAGL